MTHYILINSSFYVGNENFRFAIVTNTTVGLCNCVQPLTYHKDVIQIFDSFKQGIYHSLKSRMPCLEIMDEKLRICLYYSHISTGS